MAWTYDLDARAICLDDEVVFEATTVNHNDHGRVLDRIGVSIVNAMNGTTPPSPPEGWRPIETAPKDGTVILLACGERVTAGHWEPERWPTAAEHHSTTGEYLGQFETGECIEAWWYSEDGGFTEEHSPTHWRPLPAAPQPGDKA